MYGNVIVVCWEFETRGFGSVMDVCQDTTTTKSSTGRADGKGDQWMQHASVSVWIMRGWSG